MLNNINNIVASLSRLGLKADEAKVYIALLEGPMSHLEIARKSGVNRTKVYRVADDLVKRGLITEEVTDTGHYLAAGDPSNLEITLTTAEERLKRQREIYSQTLPMLERLYEAGGLSGNESFAVNSYEGVDGFKQMLWNELKTKGELVLFGNGAIQDLVGSQRWAEKHREKTLEAGYTVREIINPETKPEDFTKNQEFVSKVYRKRFIKPEILPLNHQVCIYNNTVAIYNWHHGQRVGTEIINKPFADMQRAIFEHYWQLAQ